MHYWLCPSWHYCLSSLKVRIQLYVNPQISSDVSPCTNLYLSLSIIQECEHNHYAKGFSVSGSVFGYFNRCPQILPGIRCHWHKKFKLIWKWTMISLFFILKTLKYRCYDTANIKITCCPESQSLFKSIQKLVILNV